MNFKWIKGSTTSPAVTIYPNNLTLNNAAASYFAEAKYAMLGIDEKTNLIAIKPVMKRELDLNLYDPTNLNKVSMGKGYARISNKTFIDEINKQVAKMMHGDKYEAIFDEHQNMLLIDLAKGEITV